MTFQRQEKPYASQLKKQVTIRLDEESIGYFKALSEEVGIPYKASSTSTCRLRGFPPQIESQLEVAPTRRME